MENTLKWYIICDLVPNPEWSGVCYGADNFEWLDERPMPTDAEVNQRNIEKVANEDIAANNKAAATAYYTALSVGYEHTDGNLYYCDERATSDMVKALSLFGIDSEEPLPVIDMHGNVHQLYIDDFRTLAAAIGRYQYGLRLVYWSSLQ